MKTFLEYVSEEDSATNLTEAVSVKNDGTIGALLAILKQDTNIIRYLKFQATRYGWPFNPELLGFDQIDNRKISTHTKHDTIKTKAFNYELPIVNTGEFTLLYYGSVGYTLLTSAVSLKNVNFSITQKPEMTINSGEHGENTYATLYVNWGNVSGGDLVLFDVTDKQVVSNLANANNQKVVGDPSKTASSNRIEYKTSDVIPLSNSQKVVEKLAKAISDYLANKTPVPEIKDVKIALYFDESINIDTKKLVSKFSEFKTSNLVVGKSVFEITLLGVDIAITNIQRIYKEINPTAGYIQDR
jgi:hypothetical protein